MNNGICSSREIKVLLWEARSLAQFYEESRTKPLRVIGVQRALHGTPDHKQRVFNVPGPTARITVACMDNLLTFNAFTFEGSNES